MKTYKILQGSFRADDGSLKGAGDEINVSDDQLTRWPVGTLEYVRDIELPPDTAPAAVAPPASAGWASGSGE